MLLSCCWLSLIFLLHYSEGRQNGTRSFRAVHWTPLQVYKPHRGDELIVSVPEGNVFSGQLLGIMGPSGCGKVRSHFVTEVC